MVSPVGGATHIVNGVTVVDCQKQVRSWRLLKSLARFLTPSCYNCNHFDLEDEVDRVQAGRYHYLRRKLISNDTSGTMITGTIFGYRRGKVSLCLQANANSTIPIIILELAIPTAILAKEMQSGLLRIALECNSTAANNIAESTKARSSSSSLLSMPVWNMFCNGRKAGFAVRRVATQADRNVMKLMRNVVVGVGIIDKETLNCDDDLMYLRANFQRVSGSSDSESFHLINPDGSSCQELSVFFLRSR